VPDRGSSGAVLGDVGLCSAHHVAGTAAVRCSVTTSIRRVAFPNGPAFSLRFRLLRPLGHEGGAVSHGVAPLPRPATISPWGGTLPSAASERGSPSWRTKANRCTANGCRRRTSRRWPRTGKGALGFVTVCPEISLTPGSALPRIPRRKGARCSGTAVGSSSVGARPKAQSAVRALVAADGR
jgi:hypothetical protein